MKKYSGCNCGCQSSREKSVKESKMDCPVCGASCRNVPLDVVFNFANKEIRDELQYNDYYICLNSDCEVAYFNNNKDIISINDIRRPIWFKKGAEPKIICYCNNITESQIKEAVREHNLKSWDKIVLHYRNRKNYDCNKLNPIGECCTDTFYKIINNTLDELGKERVDNSDDCCG